MPWRLLKKILGDNAVIQAGAVPVRPAPSAAPASTAATWLDADAPGNPFGVAGVDCSAYVRSMISTTSDPAVAASFGQLRQSDGTEHLDQLPADATAVDCDLRYDGASGDGPLFKAAAMEDKWDLYLWKGRLYCSRSWTGQLCLVAELDLAPDGSRCTGSGTRHPRRRRTRPSGSFTSSS